ncbi:uncharacterized protein LOC115217069 [Argonauta hians]
MALLEAAFGIQVTGFFVHLIAVVTVGWFRYSGFKVGLFKMCSATTCYALKTEGFLDTLKGITCLGFLLLLIAFIMAAVFMCKLTLRARKKYRIAVAVLVILGGVFAFLGPLLGFNKTGFHPQYSLYLAILAGITSIVAGSLHVTVIRQTTFETA